jgi:haloacetate dehalogenase
MPAAADPSDLLPGFDTRDVAVDDGVRLRVRSAGDGPPLLLLHGHPQTHVMWHRVAPALATRFRVVLADLRGYGDSSKPAGDAEHANYSKRVMARDMLRLMEGLGHPRFAVLAHDRGARVAHRLAADHPQAVRRMVLLDIAPTLAMYEKTTETFARAYWHWFFLIQPSPLPERLIEADPAAYLRDVMGRRSAGLAPFDRRAFAEYVRCLSLPGAAHGTCEDYRAAAGIDLLHDRTDRAVARRLPMPLLVLWGEQGVVHRCFDPLHEWGRVADDVGGQALPCGHYIAEEAPEALLEQAWPFLLRADLEPPAWGGEGSRGDIASQLHSAGQSIGIGSRLSPAVEAPNAAERRRAAMNESPTVVLASNEVSLFKNLGSSAKPCLILYSGPDAGQRFDLDPGSRIIGRLPEAAVRIDGPGISRQHAELLVGAGTVLLHDLGSANGTLVNELRITEPTKLKDGDLIRVANVVLRFHEWANLDVLLNDRVYRQTTLDTGTGAFNRKFLNEALRHEFARARGENRALSVICYDLDLFKAVNDTFGHASGDLVLRVTADIARAELRDGDALVRTGGEEFVVLLPGTPVAGALEVAERIRAAMEAFPIELANPDPGQSSRPIEHRQTVSLGVATLDDGMADEKALLEAADRALYSAKRGGRNRVITA